MITLVGGSKFAKGGPNPLANMDSRGSISASRFGPGSPYPGGSKSARTPGHCVVFLGKTLHSHSASLHPGV